MSWPPLVLLLSLLLIPVLPSLVDIIPAWRARRDNLFPIPDDHRSEEDFTVLVPIWGNIRYLEIVDFLRSYGSRVMFCTTTSETPEFDTALDAIARENGFRVYRARVTGHGGDGKRQTGGTVRDQIIRGATETVSTRYVVCLDADTVTQQPLGELVGALVANDLDLAGVKLVPSNNDSLLAKLQAHEYRMAMRMRNVFPFLCSGACQIARYPAHREIMRRHTLFFQGNDAEMGLLGDSLGYRVGYLPFEVPTTVPARAKPWVRQRIAWTGGEFRLFIVNFKLVARHPFFIFYGAFVVIGLVPMRWANLAHPGWTLVSVAAIYYAVVAVVNWRHRDSALFFYPVYGLFSSLILVPFGFLSYLYMAIPERNWGRIRIPRRRPAVRPAPFGKPAPGHVPVPGLLFGDFETGRTAVDGYADRRSPDLVPS